MFRVALMKTTVQTFKPLSLKFLLYKSPNIFVIDILNIYFDVGNIFKINLQCSSITYIAIQWNLH